MLFDLVLAVIVVVLFIFLVRWLSKKDPVVKAVATKVDNAVKAEVKTAEASATTAVKTEAAKAETAAAEAKTVEEKL